VDFIKQTEVFVVIEGTTERALGPSGIRYRSSSAMRRTDFFLERRAAEAFACKLHTQTGCTSPACGWTH
jgi:hypothetical protein